MIQHSWFDYIADTPRIHFPDHLLYQMMLREKVF